MTGNFFYWRSSGSGARMTGCQNPSRRIRDSSGPVRALKYVITLLQGNYTGPPADPYMTGGNARLGL